MYVSQRALHVSTIRFTTHMWVVLQKSEIYHATASRPTYGSCDNLLINSFCHIFLFHNSLSCIFGQFMMETSSFYDCSKRNVINLLLTVMILFHQMTRSHQRGPDGSECDELSDES
jgi:hypothetical protein